MLRSLSLVALLILGPLAGFAAGQGRKPAPPASRYGYTLVIDEKSLPKGVTIRTLKDELGTRHFIKNTSDVPLVINAVYSNEKLVGGSKLVGGKVYGYFPSGVPMEGKQHLTGWQAPFGDIPETLFVLPREPAKIYEGRQPGLGKTLPPDEPITIAVEYDGKPYEIKGTVKYHLNPAYEAKP